MPMFQWGGCFYINPEEVAAMSLGSDDKNTNPHYMTVYLRTGKEYRVNYSAASARNTDAQRLANAVNRAQPDPVSRYDLEILLDHAKDAVRRDIKALRKELTGGIETANKNTSDPQRPQG